MTESDIEKSRRLWSTAMRIVEVLEVDLGINKEVLTDRVRPHIERIAELFQESRRTSTSFEGWSHATKARTLWVQEMILDMMSQDKETEKPQELLPSGK